MALENLVGADKFISALVPGNPTGADDKRDGDNHIRGLKNVLANTFPNLNGAVTVTDEELSSIPAIAAGLGNKVNKAGDSMTGALLPATDAAVNLGDSGHRWGIVHAGRLQDGTTQGTLVSTSGSAAQFAAGNVWVADVFYTQGVERMRIDFEGKLGIGREPLAWVDIQAPAAANIRVRGGGAAGQGGAIYVTQGGSDATLVAIGDSGQINGSTINQIASVFTAGAVPLVFQVGGTERVRFNPDGNVGIGSAPFFTSANRTVLTVSGQLNAVVGFGVAGTGYGSVYVDSAQMALNSAGFMSFAPGGAERMRIDTAGVISINGHVTKFESAELACPTATGTVSVAHGGSRVPTSVEAFMRCKIAEHGYSVGDEVLLKNDVAGTQRDFSIAATATGIALVYWAGGGGTPGLRQVSAPANLVAVTAANWRLVFKAIWL